MEPVTKKIVVSCEYCKALFKVSTSLSGRQVTCGTCRRPFIAHETHVKSPNQEDEVVFLCKIALHYGLAMEKNLESFLTEYTRQTRQGSKPVIDELLMSHGRLSRENIDLVKGVRANWDLRIAEKKLAENAVKKGLITPEQAKNALIEQAQLFTKNRKIKLVSDILIDKHIVTPEQIKAIHTEKETGKILPHPLPMPAHPEPSTKKPIPVLDAIRKAVEISKVTINGQTATDSKLSGEKPQEPLQHRSLSLFGKDTRPGAPSNQEIPAVEPVARPVLKALQKAAAFHSEERLEKPQPNKDRILPELMTVKENVSAETPSFKKSEVSQTKHPETSPEKKTETKTPTTSLQSEPAAKETLTAPPDIKVESPRHPQVQPGAQVSESKPKPVPVAPVKTMEAPTAGQESVKVEILKTSPKDSTLDDIDFIVHPENQSAASHADKIELSAPDDSPVIPDAPVISRNDQPVRPHTTHQEAQADPGDDPTYLSMEHDGPVNDEEDSDDENLKRRGPRIITINGIELIISPDGLVAHLKVPEGVDPAFATVENIKNVLAEEHIIHGIVEDALIRGFLNSKIFREKPFKIAEGTPPVKGRNGTVKYHFDTDYLKVGMVTESGGIDFKNRGEIPFVKEGAILAEITPGIPGKSGMDIYGNDLLVPQIRDVALKCESGTTLSDDKRTVYAAVSGQPKLNFGDRLFVLSELVVQGDVCFKTGHIDFAGNVVIKGTIQSDFTVKGANITANDALSARIIASGDVDIKNGVGSCVIEAQGNVKAKFINKSTVKAYGNVIVEKEIIDCEIMSSGACLIERGTIITSEIISKQGIQANAIGTEMSKPSHLKIGVDDHIAAEVAVIDMEIEGIKTRVNELNSYIKDLEKNQKQIEKAIAKLAHIQDRSQLEQKQYRESLKELGDGNPQKTIDIRLKIDAIDNTIRMADKSINENFDEQDALLAELDKFKAQIAGLNEKIDDLNRQKKDILTWVQQIKTTPFIKTKGPIYSGTIIIGAHCSRVLKETMRAAHITEVKSPDAPEGWEIRIG